MELHPDRAGSLRNRFIGFDVKVVRADASDLRLPTRPFRVVANPPFSITVSLLRRLSRLEVASFAPTSLSRGTQRGGGCLVQGLAGTAGLAPSTSSRRPLPRSAFRPPPPSSVAILTIIRKRSSR